MIKIDLTTQDLYFTGEVLIKTWSLFPDTLVDKLFLFAQY